MDKKCIIHIVILATLIPTSSVWQWNSLFSHWEAQPIDCDPLHPNRKTNWPINGFGYTEVNTVLNSDHVNIHIAINLD